jgi:hypothetical protein
MCLAFNFAALAIHDSADSESFIAEASGVGHPEKSLADMGSADNDAAQPLGKIVKQRFPNWNTASKPFCHLSGVDNDGMILLPDARSAQIGGPDLIGQFFHLKTYSSEPCASKRARNLLSKHRCRFALGDKPSELRPEVSLVGCAFSLSGATEWLTWA